MKGAPETWIGLAEAMQIALWGMVTPYDVDIYEAVPLSGSLLTGLDPADADGFNAIVASLQRQLQAAASAGRLPMKGQPKRFMEEEPENTSRREMILTDWFAIDAVRGFDFEDGSILPFSHEAGETHRYDALMRPTGALQPATPDEYRFVLVERGAFLVFLRNDLGAVLVGGSGPELGSVDMPAMLDAELIEMLRAINTEMGGTEERPIAVRQLYESVQKRVAGKFGHVTQRRVEGAYKSTFPGRRGSGRLPKADQAARVKARKESVQEK